MNDSSKRWTWNGAYPSEKFDKHTHWDPWIPAGDDLPTALSAFISLKRSLYRTIKDDRSSRVNHDQFAYDDCITKLLIWVNSPLSHKVLLAFFLQPESFSIPSRVRFILTTLYSPERISTSARPLLRISSNNAKLLTVRESAKAKGVVIFYCHNFN